MVAPLPVGSLLEPHHDGSPLYVSTQSPQLGDRVRVRVRIPHEFGAVQQVRTRSNPNHEPRFAVASLIATVDGWDWWEAEVEVENPTHGYRWLIKMGDGRNLWLNATGMHTIETLDSEDFKLLAYPAPPEWATSTIMYQIFPDRFARSAAADARQLPAWAEPAKWDDPVIHIGPSTATQLYGGDLQGIQEHLDHLIGLGVTMIYLTPVFPARSNHRYDALSFDEIDPLLGGDEAYIALIEAAHARGLRVIGDLTSNHSGDAHEWFQASHEKPGTPESAFYYWMDQEQKTYVSWLGVPSLPKFNWNSQELRERFIEGPDSVVAKWLKPPYSLDGWRIDVANMTGRYLAEDLNAEVRQIIRRTMIEVNPDTILLGESTNDASSDFQGDAWHGAMTYTNFTRPLWGWLSDRERESSYFGLPFGTIPSYSGVEVFEAHQQFAAGFPWRVRLHTMNALDTHDTPRFLTHARPGTVPVALGLSMTMPGIPVVFAGDEFGLVGDDGEHSRTPIPWEHAADAEPTLELYRRLIHLKREHPALNGGGIRWLHVSDDVLVFVRESEEEAVLVVAARADFELSLAPNAVSGVATLIVGDADALFDPAVGLVLRGRGPAFAAWVLPGIDIPEFAAEGTVLELEG
ncbi:glycoside hydrolase family 13 protein [Galbitalea soli]|uniref:Glycoside hydrolase family 13 protein n=1 Tax=Galbitalea soli TaxID=1268042 RepID=A0A7C9PML4_9MICO|nr:glycoside hydrolase family 13 protein [Galbitalea soli]NEM91053.1 glycoside hydrolase family 13 protein [Galbitalea soli]NYJ29741.1 alpha-glucosidase [Galbitalea soli]